MYYVMMDGNGDIVGLLKPEYIDQQTHAAVAQHVDAVDGEELEKIEMQKTMEGHSIIAHLTNGETREFSLTLAHVFQGN